MITLYLGDTAPKQAYFRAHGYSRRSKMVPRDGIEPPTP